MSNRVWIARRKRTKKLKHNRKDKRPAGEYEIIQGETLDEAADGMARSEYDFTETEHREITGDMRVVNGEIVTGPLSAVERMAAKRRTDPNFVRDVTEIVMMMRAMEAAGFEPGKTNV